MIVVSNPGQQDEKVKLAHKGGGYTNQEILLPGIIVMSLSIYQPVLVPYYKIHKTPKENSVIHLISAPDMWNQIGIDIIGPIM